MTHPVPASALEYHGAILGRSGSGKSYTARGLAERLLAERRRVCVIDPTGAWWGLRLNAAGDGPSANELAIFGGQHGDMPLTDVAGPALARLIATRNLPCIIDLSAMSKTKQRSFMAGFLETLYEVNREPLHLVMDEADLFVPQRVPAEMARLVGAVDDIVRRGRIFGFRTMLITQRAAVINKDVLSQIGLLIAMRSASPQDRGALEAWFEGHGDKAEARRVFDTLGGLKPGEGWIWAPDLGILQRVSFPANSTYDSSAAPVFGQSAPQPVTLAQIDLSEIRAALEPPATAQPNAKAGRAAQPDHADELYDWLGKLETQVADLTRRLNFMDSALDAFRGAARDFGHTMAAIELRGDLPSTFRASVAAAPAETERTAPVSPIPRAAKSTNGGTLGAERKPLAVLAAAAPAGLSEAAWATLAGFKRSGGTWSTYRGRLKGAGMIEGDSAQWRATAAGIEAVGSELPAMPSPGPALVAFWADRIPGAGKMLKRLAERHPAMLSRHDLAADLGMTASGGTFNTYLGRLRSNGLIVERDKHVGIAPVIMGGSK